MISSLYNKKLYDSIFLWYAISLIATGILFPNCALKPYLYIMGVISVAMFTFGSPKYFLQRYKSSNKQFLSDLFLFAFAIRLFYVIFIYYFNIKHYGTFYESSVGDIGFYHGVAMEFVNMEHRNMSFFQILKSWNVGVDDSGYIIYLTLLYKITGATETAFSVLFALVMKSVIGAYTCVYSYKIASRHFGEDVGRMAGIFCALHFSMIWWCGSMMKETEMVFCTMAALYYTDKVLSTGALSGKDIIMAILAVTSTFFFRTVLGVLLVLSMCAALFFAKDQVIGKKKKRTLIVFSVLLLSLSAGNKIYEMSHDLVERASGNHQEVNMEWRSKREGGNSFAKYAGAAVFAPMIFTIPFPTMVYTDQTQEMQMQVCGGNYLKNVLSFFVVLTLVTLFFSKKWRSHTLLIAFMCGYVVALVFSEFAQSGRFHMPIMPVFMIFTAYGMTLMNNRTYKWFRMVLPVEMLICIAWSWFKLAGRGLV